MADLVYWGAAGGLWIYTRRRAGGWAHAGGDMSKQIDWATVIADPRFQTLARRKSRFLWGLMGFSVMYYFALPIGAAYFQDLFKIRIWGPVNVGLAFALSEFLMAWLVAFLYSRVANREFDRLAMDIAAAVDNPTGG